MKHLTLFELADPNNDQVDAVMNDAQFLPTPTQIGDILEYDRIKCSVLQTYKYSGTADFSLTLAIVYPPELTLNKEDWFCNQTATMGLQQTRYIFVSPNQRVIDVSSIYVFDEPVAPTNETISLQRGWQMRDYHTFKCDSSPYPNLYVANCEQRVLQPA